MLCCVSYFCDSCTHAPLLLLWYRWAGKVMVEVTRVFTQVVKCVQHLHEKGRWVTVTVTVTVVGDLSGW